MQKQFQQSQVSVRRALLAGTAFTGALVFGVTGHSGSALAACIISGAGAANTVTCDTTVTTATTNTNAASTTSSDYKQEFTAGGAVTGMVNAGQTVSGEGLWISTTEAGSPITFTNSGAVTGASNGLQLSSAGGNIAYSGNGSANGGAIGLLLDASSGNGAIAVGTSGAPVAGNFSGTSGMAAQSSSGAINVFLNGGSLTATAGNGGGLTMGSDTGSISATLTGNTTIANASGAVATTIGIQAMSTSAFADAINVSSDANIGSLAAEFKAGIQAFRLGTGNINVSQTGGAIFAETFGLVVTRSAGAGTISINTSAGSTINVSSSAGASAGVFAQTQGAGAGAVNVTTAGTITGGGSGISASIANAANTGDITVAANGNVTGNNTGIGVSTTGSGNLNVSIGGGATVQGINGQGVVFQGGAVNTLTNNGAIVGQTGIATTDGSTTIINSGSITGISGLAFFLSGDHNTFIMSGPAATLTGGAIGSATDTFRFAGSGSNSFDLAQIGPGWTLLDKTGSSNWTLTGTSTYAGPVTVNGGTLSVNTDLSAASLLTVNAGGAIGGNGTVGETLINGGALAPGNSIGTLTVAGNLTMTSASSYMVEVSPTNADRVNVTGTATLGGATVNASFAPGSYVTRQYTILNATGGLIGRFGSQVNTSLPSSFSSNLSYDANNAYLNLTLDYTPPVTPTAPTSVPLDTNQTNVGNALTGFFNRTGGIPLVFGTLSPSGLSQLSGETGTGSQQTTIDAMNLFMGLMTDTFTAGRDIAPTVGAVPYADATMSYGAKRRPSDALAAIYRKAPPMASLPQERWNVWAAGFGGSRSSDGNAVTGSNNTTSSIYGTAVGADYWFSPQTVAGFALAGGGTNFSVANGGSGRSDLFQAGAFVRHTVGSAYVTAAAAYGWQDITTDRNVTVAGLDRLRAGFNANSYSARVEGGNRFVVPSLGGVGITPYAAVQVTAFDLPAYVESANGGSGIFALNYAAKTVTDTRAELGLRSDKAFAIDDAMLTLRGRAAWAHNTNADRTASATFQTLPGASFVVNGAALARDAALTTASAEMTFRTGLSLAATFEGEFSDLTQSYAGKGVVRYQW